MARTNTARLELRVWGESNPPDPPDQVILVESAALYFEHDGSSGDRTVVIGERTVTNSRASRARELHRALEMARRKLQAIEIELAELEGR
jgi:hypothetical protein